ncbi:hypothetical protein GJAV_G00104950 [Gymnothorax javanicus]|nr:hypothetical protein GJAV_G00104950 [Gymnothorax javanicus]
MRSENFMLILLTLCCSGKLSPSSKLILARLGENVTLPCSQPLTSKLLWFRQRSDEMFALTTSIKGKTKGFYDVYSEEDDATSHFTTQEDNLTKSINLKITGVKESDQGLYYYSEKATPLCWTLLVSVPPVVAVVTALCVCGLCHSRTLCRKSVNNTDYMESADLHYASLRLPKKQRPSRQRKTPPLSGGIIYDSVALQFPANRNP